MRNAVIKTWNRLLGNEEGLTLVEYGVGAILAVAVGGVTLVALSGAINTKLTEAQTTISSN